MRILGFFSKGRKATTNSAKFKVIHALEPLPKSIFLAGPTPRSVDVPSWRPEALWQLEKLGFEGEVLLPESRDWLQHESYDDQIWWELEALERATVVVVWIPREMTTMPAFTTNVEFGYMVKSGKVLLGAPEGAPKMNYLRMVGEKHNVPYFTTLESILAAAIEKAGRGGRG